MVMKFQQSITRLYMCSLDSGKDCSGPRLNICLQHTPSLGVIMISRLLLLLFSLILHDLFAPVLGRECYEGKEVVTSVTQTCSTQSKCIKVVESVG